MEQARLLLAIALSFLVFLVWNLFFIDRQPLPPPDQPLQADRPATSEPRTEPVEMPEEQPLPLPDQTAPATRPPRILTVDTPFYRVELSEQGAVFQSFVLKDYREEANPDAPFKQLIAPDLPGTVQTGFIGGGLPSLRDVTFTADVEMDSLPVQDAPRELRFTWTSPQGVVFEKRYTFSPATYLIGLDVTIRNASGQTIQGSPVVALASHIPEQTRYGFQGPSALIDDSVEQIKIDKIDDKNNYVGPVRWVSLESRYFMTSVVAREVSDEARMHLVVKGEDLLENQYIGPVSEIPPGMQQEYPFSLFLGPKSLKILDDFENGLSAAIDFGMFDFIAKPCLWLMNFLYSFIPNYGIAIIILTTFIKLILWPLGNKSYKSMNDMKRIQPLMAEIREKYKDDKRKMNEELMKLYKVYRINPMGGCLPMLLQIPVFFALYRMLYEAIELRHAPFLLWINDLSAPDRLFRFDFPIPFMQPPYGIPVLTIIMGATMLLQQKMSPPPGDPAQAKMMMFLPVVFTFIFINFPAGLVLYWLVNNILSITQQYYISKKNA